MYRKRYKIVTSSSDSESDSDLNSDTESSDSSSNTSSNSESDTDTDTDTDTTSYTSSENDKELKLDPDFDPKHPNQLNTGKNSETNENGRREVHYENGNLTFKNLQFLINNSKFLYFYYLTKSSIF